MRILVVANQVASVGGLERCQLEISRELARRGHGIDLLHVQTGDLLGEWMSFATSTQQVRPFVLDRRALLASPGQLLSAVRAGRRPRPDIVYVHRYQDALLGGLVARSLGHRAVCHLHLPPPKSPSLQVTLGMRQMALCIAVSTHTAESWQPWGIVPSRLRVVHNGIDTARFQLLSDAERQTERARMGLGPADHVVLYAGRLHPDKGIDVLLDAVARARGSVDKVRLVIVGGPNPSTHASRAHADSYVAGLQERVDPAWAQLLQPRPEVSRLLAMADVLALPSRWPEPFPLVLLEALACGTPVVASRVGGIPELLEGAAGAALVQPDDPAALADGLLEFQGWRDSHPDGPQANRRHVEERFSLTSMVDAVERCLVPGSHGHTTRQ